MAFRDVQYTTFCDTNGSANIPFVFETN